MSIKLTPAALRSAVLNIGRSIDLESDRGLVPRGDAKAVMVKSTRRTSEAVLQTSLKEQLEVATKRYERPEPVTSSPVANTSFHVDARAGPERVANWLVRKFGFLSVEMNT